MQWVKVRNALGPLCLCNVFLLINIHHFEPAPKTCFISWSLVFFIMNPSFQLFDFDVILWFHPFFVLSVLRFLFHLFDFDALLFFFFCISISVSVLLKSSLGLRCCVALILASPSLIPILYKGTSMHLRPVFNVHLHSGSRCLLSHFIWCIFDAWYLMPLFQL